MMDVGFFHTFDAVSNSPAGFAYKAGLFGIWFDIFMIKTNELTKAEGGIFMKKLTVLIMLGVLFYGSSSATEPTFNGYKTLKFYQAKSLDEEKIVKLVLEFQKANNLYDINGVLAVYLPGAIIKAGVKDDWSEHMVTKEEYVSILEDKLSKWKMYSFQLKLFTPRNIHIEGNNANFNVPYILYSITQNYWEKGIFNFDFRKADSGWLIKKNTWEVVDLFYHP